ncbi:hypothetical protein AAZX31_09G065300 [Glycine max]
MWASFTEIWKLGCHCGSINKDICSIGEREKSQARELSTTWASSCTCIHVCTLLSSYTHKDTQE